MKELLERSLASIWSFKSHKTQIYLSKAFFFENLFENEKLFFTLKNPVVYFEMTSWQRTIGGVLIKVTSVQSEVH